VLQESRDELLLHCSSVSPGGIPGFLGSLSLLADDEELIGDLGGRKLIDSIQVTGLPFCGIPSQSARSSSALWYGPGNSVVGDGVPKAFQRVWSSKSVAYWETSAKRRTGLQILRAHM
jgi:hypothetical protein